MTLDEYKNLSKYYTNIWFYKNLAAGSWRGGGSLLHTYLYSNVPSQSRYGELFIIVFVFVFVHIFSICYLYLYLSFHHYICPIMIACHGFVSSAIFIYMYICVFVFEFVFNLVFVFGFVLLFVIRCIWRTVFHIGTQIWLKTLQGNDQPIDFNSTENFMENYFELQCHEMPKEFAPVLAKYCCILWICDSFAKILLLHSFLSAHALETP